MTDQNAADLISLPQGGGALAGIGETFQPDPHTGTGKFNVPLPLPTGRNGFQPKLSLGYSTGSPNSVFGLGWDLAVPQVRRKTSQGIPRYRDDADVFVLSGAEDLVPVAATDGSHRYRPRTETGFARITHVRDPQAGDYWEIRSKDGLRSRYGTPRSPDAGWSDPAVIAGPDGIFGWLLSETVDLLGNRIVYDYVADAGGGPMRHLARVRYVDYGDAAESRYLVAVDLSYAARPDPFSDRRPGFELRTTQRATGIAITTQSLAKTVELTYADEAAEPASNGVSLLSGIRIVGHDGDAPPQPLAPLQFSYTEWRPQDRTLLALTGGLPAVSLGEPGLDLVDLFGDGRPSVLQLNGSALYWRNRGGGVFDPARPLSAVPAGVALGSPGVQLADMDGDGRPDLVASTATGTGYWPLRPRGEDGQGAPAGFDPAGFVPALAAPAVSLSDPSVRLIDLDGDGRMDLLRAGPRLIAAYNDGHGSFQSAQVLEPPDGLGEIDFADPRVRLADMTGDGLTDIVVLHSGSVGYWPNLGHGRFGARVEMADPPDFEDGAEYDVTGFDPRRLLLGDVVGDGAADLVYVGDGHVTVWVNQSGNRFADADVIAGTPRVTDSSAIRLADVNGIGVSGVLWSADRVRPGMRDAFLDLTGAVKPYLLSRVDNHRGLVTAIEYASSTAYAEADSLAGAPWRTTLPMPVHVVSRLTVTDAFSRSRLTTEYDYHHGYWDGADREFRGFARVEQRDAQRFADAGDGAYEPPTETRTWYHVGPVGPELGDWQPLDLRDEYWQEDPGMLGAAVLESLPEGLSRRRRRDACRALRGLPLRVEIYALDGDAAQDRPYTVTEHQYEVTLAGDPQPSAPATGPALTVAWAGRPEPANGTPDADAVLPFFPHAVAQRTTEWERGSDPRTRVKWTDGYDGYGRSHRTIEVAVPRGRDPLESLAQAAEPYLATAAAVSYATRDDDRYICDRQVANARYELVNDGSLSLTELRRSADAGAPARLLSYNHLLYDDQPVGSLGDWGLTTGAETLALTLGQLARAYSADGTDADPAALPPYLMTGDAVPADGLRAEYFRDAALTQRALVRPERAIDHDWQSVSVDPVLAPGAAGARWTGTVSARYGESYTFTVDGDGGARLWIAGALVVNAPAATGGRTSAPVALAADTPVALELELTGATRVQVRWSSPSQALETVPQERLAPPAAPVAWPAEYVDAFRAALPAGAGYVYRRAGAAHFDGFYSSTRRRYDVQDAPGSGRGLLVWQEDELGNRTTVRYDAPYALLPAEVTDPAGLIRSASFDYRVLQPSLVTDANGNQTAVAYTPLGLPASVAVMGKPGEQVGDTPDHPGTWFEYGLTAYDDGESGDRQPAWVHTTRRVDRAWTVIGAEAARLGRPPTADEIAALFSAAERDTHPERFTQRREYSDGLGRALQTRAQAGELIVDDLGLALAADAPPAPVTVHRQPPGELRVTVSGWQAYDNKNRVVEKWEPCFDEGWDYATPTDAQLAGVLRKVTTYYDPLGLAVLTVQPDGSQQRVVPGIPADLADPSRYAPTPWEVYTYDQNDEAGRTDPTGSQEYRDHWNTPGSTVQDALGRVTGATRRTVAGAELVTLSRHDIDGNLLEVVDPLGRTASAARYDLLKRAWRSERLDAGAVRSVQDPRGGVVELRDGKGALALADFDALHRRRRRWARDRAADLPTLRERVVFGEAAGIADAAAVNALGRPYETYDEAGREQTPLYDFQGNLLTKRRQVLSSSVLLSALPAAGGDWSGTAYRVDWHAADADNDALLDTTVYETATTYDALQRPTSIEAPLDVTGSRATLTPSYDMGGSLAALRLDGTAYVERLVHNARGQRVLCVLGNGVMTRCAYDPDTFRLARLRSEPCRPLAQGGSGWEPAGAVLQDHAYGYDPVGNLVILLDTTPGSGVAPEPDRLERRFAYDPLYRLVSATGREADLPGVQEPWLGAPPDPDVTRVRAYTETYDYDAVGSLLALAHRAPVATGSYTRTFTPADKSNRCAQLTVRGDVYAYAYDGSGNVVSETTSRLFEWDHGDRLATYRTQASPASEPSVYTQYRYDLGGRRVVKATRNQGGDLSVTVSIDGLFERLTLTRAGTAASYDTLHVNDAATRVALTRIGPAAPGDTTPPVLYQLGDHLGSGEVALDLAGGFVGREEFLPYGETSFGGYARKRYRFTGKERDEESGLYYHGARYYAPWLCRWIACDPSDADGPNLYAYARCSPLCAVDRDGREAQSPAQPQVNACSASAQTQQSGGAPPEGDAAHDDRGVAGGAGYGLYYATPTRFTLSVPDSYSFTKMRAYQHGVLESEIGRNAGQGNSTSARRTSATQRNARAEFEIENPMPTETAPGGRGWARDHRIELQHDLTGEKGNRSLDYDWRDRAVNDREGSLSWELQRNNPLHEPAGAVVRAAEAGRWYNSVETRAVGNAAGKVLLAYGIYQSGSHVVTAVQADVSAGTGGAQTARAVAHEAGGWAGSLAGAEALAPWGVACGPAAWVCVPALGLVGGGLGFWAGSYVADTTIDVGIELTR